MRRERRRIRVTGTVQGVGFRPFVYREAVALGLVGSVGNDSAGVLIEAQGAPERLDELCRRLVAAAPPLAQVASVRTEAIPLTSAEATFGIAVTDDDGPADVPVSVDAGPCEACLTDLHDPADRRHRYPFINCTDCGPRYTITRQVPYDRPNTTMAAFTMCAACQAEYDDPRDRRFHAQPNACPQCGPTLTVCDPAGAPIATADAALRHAVTLLRSGHIVAVKGIGGFHLAVDAANDGAVHELRRRKARDDKPFAVLVADLEQARILCDLDAAAEAALVSPRRPIVLAPRRADARVAAAVAPGMPELGVLLPPSPLHHLLVADSALPLVLTSGNVSDEPIVHRDADAFTRLAPLADAVLTHDRDIHIRCDDSVLRSGVDAALQPIRRSRGYAPEPLPLPVPPGGTPLLAVGAELKNTVAVSRDGWAVASHHIGDLEHYASYASFLQAVEHLTHLYGVRPDVVAHDLHPEYLSTKYALELDLPTVAVQHHHAHIASCLAEHGETRTVLGIAFDGLGFGADGTLWGGEFLVADLFGFERVAHLRPVALPGGAAAIREPWRMAIAWLEATLGPDAALREGNKLDPRAEAVLAVARSGRAPVTTSAGRLFDAASAMLGVRGTATYEGQAAIELEALARRVRPGAAPVYPVGWDGRVLDPAPLFAALLADRGRGMDLEVCAAAFHNAVAVATADAAITLAADRTIDTVALSGGVFQNRRLTELVAERLRRVGLRVLCHHVVPCNDGGISIGQAAVAAAASHR